MTNSVVHSHNNVARALELFSTTMSQKYNMSYVAGFYETVLADAIFALPPEQRVKFVQRIVSKIES
jgi:hypothetical protein